MDKAEHKFMFLLYMKQVGYVSSNIGKSIKIMGKEKKERKEKEICGSLTEKNSRSWISDEPLSRVLDTNFSSTVCH